jgi:hypothetical protein
MLLLTHGWRAYSWNDMFGLRKPGIRYPLETSLSFSGKVELGKRQNEEQVVNVTAVFRQDTIRKVMFGQPEVDGSFLFAGYHFSDTAEVLLSAIAVNNRKTPLKLSVENQVFPLSDNFFYSQDTYSDSLKVEIFGEMPKLMGDLESTIFELPEIQITARRFRGKSNQIHNSAFSSTVYEADKNFTYTSSTSQGAMAILDFIPQMRRLREGGRTYYDAVSIGPDGEKSSEIKRGEDIEPYYILDGIRVDKTVIESTPARRIARVELLTGPSAMIYGSGAFAGAVVFHSKRWDETSNSRPGYTFSYKFVGYNQEKEFYSPDYSKPQQHFRPDYRKTLYWQPEVMPDQDGKATFNFFTSDESGEYIIHCEGISTTNEIGVAQGRFSVF